MLDKEFWDNKRRWDNQAVLDYARDEGRKEGRKIGERQAALEVAERMKKVGSYPFEEISRYTKLSIEEIENL